MATKFDITAFRASPFMQALVETDQVPEAEKVAARRIEKAKDSSANWRCWRLATVAYHRLVAAQVHASYACVRNDDDRDRIDMAAVAALDAFIKINDEWFNLPAITKEHAKDRRMALKLYRSRDPLGGQATHIESKIVEWAKLAEGR